MEEGDVLTIDEPELELKGNRPVVFSFFSSSFSTCGRIAPAGQLHPVRVDQLAADRAGRAFP